MMKLLRLTLLGSLLTFSGTTIADSLSFAIGGGIWSETPSGSIKKTTDPTDVSVENQLFWSAENQPYFFATLEHPVPILPNVRIMMTQMEHSGSGTATYEYNGQTFSGTVSNKASLDQTDFTFYWQVLDNVVNLDLGLNAKLLDSSINIQDSFNNTTSVSTNIVLPMVYGLFGISPLSGLYLGIEGSYVTYDGNTVSDFIAKVSYTTNFYVGVEAGYRAQQLKLEDLDNTTGNLDFKGPFAGLYAKF